MVSMRRRAAAAYFVQQAVGIRAELWSMGLGSDCLAVLDMQCRHCYAQKQQMPITEYWRRCGCAAAGAGKPIVDNCMGGYNSTIFAYGQTGAGKTYTMQGPMAVALEECEEVSSLTNTAASSSDIWAQCGDAAAHIFASSIGIVQHHLERNAVGMPLHVQKCQTHTCN
jgi:hypothetical protein